MILNSSKVLILSSFSSFVTSLPAFGGENSDIQVLNSRNSAAKVCEVEQKYESNKKLPFINIDKPFYNEKISVSDIKKIFEKEIPKLDNQTAGLHAKKFNEILKIVDNQKTLNRIDRIRLFSYFTAIFETNFNTYSNFESSDFEDKILKFNDSVEILRKARFEHLAHNDCAVEIADFEKLTSTEKTTYNAVSKLIEDERTLQETPNQFSAQNNIDKANKEQLIRESQLRLKAVKDEIFSLFYNNLTPESFTQYAKKPINLKLDTGESISTFKVKIETKHKGPKITKLLKEGSQLEDIINNTNIKKTMYHGKAKTTSTYDNPVTGAEQSARILLNLSSVLDDIPQSNQKLIEQGVLNLTEKNTTEASFKMNIFSIAEQITDSLKKNKEEQNKNNIIKGLATLGGLGIVGMYLYKKKKEDELYERMRTLRDRKNTEIKNLKDEYKENSDDVVKKLFADDIETLQEEAKKASTIFVGKDIEGNELSIDVSEIDPIKGQNKGPLTLLINEFIKNNSDHGKDAIYEVIELNQDIFKFKPVYQYEDLQRHFTNLVGVDPKTPNKNPLIEAAVYLIERLQKVDEEAEKINESVKNTSKLSQVLSLLKKLEIKIIEDETFDMIHWKKINRKGQIHRENYIKDLKNVHNLIDIINEYEEVVKNVKYVEIISFQDQKFIEIINNFSIELNNTNSELIEKKKNSNSSEIVKLNETDQEFSEINQSAIVVLVNEERKIELSQENKIKLSHESKIKLSQKRISEIYKKLSSSDKFEGVRNQADFCNNHNFQFWNESQKENFDSYEFAKRIYMLSQSNSIDVISKGEVHKYNIKNIEKKLLEKRKIIQEGIEFERLPKEPKITNIELSKFLELTNQNLVQIQALDQLKDLDQHNRDRKICINIFNEILDKRIIQKSINNYYTEVKLTEKEIEKSKRKNFDEFGVPYIDRKFVENDPNAKFKNLKITSLVDNLKKVKDNNAKQNIALVGELIQKWAKEDNPIVDPWESKELINEGSTISEILIQSESKIRNILVELKKHEKLGEEENVKKENKSTSEIKEYLNIVIIPLHESLTGFSEFDMLNINYFDNFDNFHQRIDAQVDKARVNAMIHEFNKVKPDMSEDVLLLNSVSKFLESFDSYLRSPLNNVKNKYYNSYFKPVEDIFEVVNKSLSRIIRHI